MRFRIRTVRRRKYLKWKRKRGRGLPYTKNNHVYFGQGVVGKVLGNLISQIADSLIPV